MGWTAQSWVTIGNQPSATMHLYRNFSDTSDVRGNLYIFTAQAASAGP